MDDFEKINVLYTGSFRFPDLDAAAFRVQGVGSIFEEVGCRVDFAGWELAGNGVSSYVYKGHRCFPQAEFRVNNINFILRLFGFVFRGVKTAVWIYRNRSSYSFIVIYNPPAIFALATLIIGKLSGLKVILDCTEWYQSSHLVGGKYGLASLENWLRMRVIYKLFSNIIVISNYLKNYFSNANVLLIPPLSPSSLVKHSERPAMSDGISLIYAGDAGKKDKLLPVLRLLPYLSDKLNLKITLSVLGMNESELDIAIKNCDESLSRIKKHVNCLGRVSREEVMNLYSRSHFSILFRDNERYAKAGFPTKAMESMVNGCPLITNAVGDLSIILNSENSIIVNEADIDQNLLPLIQEVLDEGQYDSISEAARNSANQYFDSRAYKDKLNSFIKCLV